MKKRRLIRWLLILAILTAFAVWLEPTRVVWGWLRGEAFYEGRPTSYWSREIQGWRCVGGEGRGPTTNYCTTEYYARWPGPWEAKFARFFKNKKATWPTVFDGDPAAETVLRELANDASPYVRAWGEEGLDRLKTGRKGPNVARYSHDGSLGDRTSRDRKPTPHDAWLR